MGLIDNFIDTFFGPPSKKKYDAWLAKLNEKKRDFEEIIEDRKKGIPAKVWSRIQGWSAEEIQKRIVEIKYGEAREQISGLLLEHLHLASEILSIKGRIAEMQRDIDNLIKERARYYGQELQTA